MQWAERVKPGARKPWLHALAGLVWSGVGIMLIAFAMRWIGLARPPVQVEIVLAGVLLASGTYFFGFSRLAKKNIRRIQAYTREKVCLFAFQQWSSYPMVAFMMALGIYLRIYSPLPKPLLAVLYIGIGGGLFLSSFHYHRVAFARQGLP